MLIFTKKYPRKSSKCSEVAYIGLAREQQCVFFLSHKCRPTGQRYLISHLKGQTAPLPSLVQGRGQVCVTQVKMLKTATVSAERRGTFIQRNNSSKLTLVCAETLNSLNKYKNNKF
jgi:hypothetical protein